MQFLPLGQHVNDTSQLHHEQGDNVKWIVVARIEYIDRPYVDVMDVIAPGHRMFVQSMEMPTQTHIFLHAQNITNDCDVLLWTQMLSLSGRTDREDFLIVCVEYIRLIRGRISVKKNRIKTHATSSKCRRKLTSRRNQPDFPRRRIPIGLCLASSRPFH